MKGLSFVEGLCIGGAIGAVGLSIWVYVAGGMTLNWLLLILFIIHFVVLIILLEKSPPDKDISRGSDW